MVGTNPHCVLSASIPAQPFHTIMNTQAGLKWAPWVSDTLIYTRGIEKYPLNDELKLTVGQTPPVLSCTGFQIQYYFKCRNFTTGLFTVIWKIKLQLCICILYFKGRLVRVFVVVLLYSSTQGLSSALLTSCYSCRVTRWSLTAEQSGTMEISDSMSLIL